MSKNRKGRVLYVAFWLQATVGLVLLVSGVVKARRPGEFRAAVKAYYIARRLRHADVAAVAIVPGAEIFSGLVLITRILSPWVAGAVALPLLAIFTIAVYINVRHGVVTSCGCGLGRSVTGSPLIIRNLLAMGALGAGLSVSASSTLPSGSASIVVLYLLSGVSAVFLLYLPAFGEEFRHQLGHVR